MNAQEDYKAQDQRCHDDVRLLFAPQPTPSLSNTCDFFAKPRAAARWGQKAGHGIQGFAPPVDAFRPHRDAAPLWIGGHKKARPAIRAGDASLICFTKEAGLAAARPARCVSVRRVPDDDLLGLVIAGSRGDVAIDGAEFRRGQRDGDVLLPGVLRDPVPTAAQFEAVLAADDAVIGLVVLHLAGVFHERNLGGDAERRELAFEGAVSLLCQCCDGSHGLFLSVARGPFPDDAKERGRTPPSPSAARGTPCGLTA